MKTKFKVILVVMVMLLVGVLLAIPKTTYDKWFNGNQNNNDIPNVDNRPSEVVYVKNQEGKLVGLSVKVDKIEEDEILQKWNLLTTNSNLLPAGYTSAINNAATLNSYEIKNGVLELNVSEEIKLSEGRKTLETIAWTFINGEINEVSLVVNGEKITEVNGYKISKITKKMGINLEYETSYLLESTATTIVYSLDEYMLPVTYFHLEEDICSYIVDKTYEKFDVNDVWNYEYELNEEALVINFIDDVKIEEDILVSLTKSIESNFNLVKFSITNQEENLYEAVFGEIEDVKKE